MAAERILSYEVRGEQGLHMRPCAQIVAIASAAKARGIDVLLRVRDETADACSMLSLMMLVLKHGDLFDVVLRSSEDKIAPDTFQKIHADISGITAGLSPVTASHLNHTAAYGQDAETRQNRINTEKNVGIPSRNQA